MDIEKLSLEIIENIKKAAGVNAVFGEPIQQGNKMIIPVAKVKLGGCGGGGGGGHKSGSEPADKKRNGFGLGFGLKIKSRPIGYIEIKDDKARFVHIIDKAGIVMAGLSVLALSIWALGKSPRPRIFI